MFKHFKTFFDFQTFSFRFNNSMLIDTHAHLDFSDFMDDLPAILQRASDTGVQRIITIGTDVASSQRSIALAEQHDMIYAAVGIHPCNANDETDDSVSRLALMLAHPKVVAIGECGLDYYHLPKRLGNESEAEYNSRLAPWQARQKLFFSQQLELAANHRLNVIIHQRHSWDDTLEILFPWNGRLRAVFHCFGETQARADQLLQHGHLVSFTGIITFKNAQAVRDVAKNLPADRFMVETDCPYLAPVPHRGKRCEPAFVRRTAESIADLRQQPLVDLLMATTRTAEGFFRFSNSR
jgi:TatD DNase family protein